MEGAAKITSVDALVGLRGALIKFKSEGMAALIETESEIQRTLVWLRHDQASYWQRQVRARQELLGRAKSDLFRKQVAQDLEVRVGVDQKKAVEKAKRELAQAEEKVETVRRWIHVLDKELVLYRGETQGLSSMLEGGIPEALKRLDGMIGSIEAYLAVSGTGGAAAEREMAGLGPSGTDAEKGAAEDGTDGGPDAASGRDERLADTLGADEAGLERPEEP